MCHMKNLFKMLLGRERWHRAIILFAAIFIFSVIIQFALRWYERGAEARKDLIQSAEVISHELKYLDRWDLKNLRQADFAEIAVGSYCILDSNGLNIEIEGFVPAMEFRVNFDKRPPGLLTVTVPETGETWRLLVQPLSDGTVVLGIRSPGMYKNVDDIIGKYAKLFKSSIDAALRVKVNELNENIELALIDKDNNLLYAIGGVPLRMMPIRTVPFDIVSDVPKAGANYGVYSRPYPDSPARTVGSILTYKELPPKPWLIIRNWIVNCLSSAVLAFFGTLIGIPYIGEKFDPRRLLNNALQTGESQTVEFKESLHWHQVPGQPPVGDSKKKLSGEEIVIRTMAAFLNNQDGGTLLIGIKDDMSIVGLEQDYEYLGKRGDRNKERDRFQMHLRDILATKIRQDVSNLYIETAIVEHAGSDVCIMHARPASVPIYIPIALVDSKTKAFFVRDGASTKPLDVEQTMDYIEQRWPRSFWRRIANMLRTS